MDVKEILSIIRSSPTWVKVISLVVAILCGVCILFTSCSRRTFSIHAAGERVEFSYKDSLQKK